jgi:HK97 family phage portal protein
MGFFDRFREKRMITSIDSIERPGTSILGVLGLGDNALPAVTIDTALTVPAVSAAVTFLSSSMANLPLHAYSARGEESKRVGGKLQRVLNEAPNPDWSSFGFRKYMWQQVFTGGRAFAWIERNGAQVEALWPMDPSLVKVKREGVRKVYQFDGKKTYSSDEIVDLPFMLKSDQLASYSPIVNGAKAIQLALSMGDYGSGFFAGGGIPPLVMTGPIASGPEVQKRALKDVETAIAAARKRSEAMFAIPPGYELKPVGIDPEKSQMTEARRFAVEEIARIYNLPPVFLQDLTHGTFSNTEQQDLHLVKHLIAQWAKAFEEELNLKLFGAENSRRYCEHSLDGLMRGDFKSRLEGLARAIQTAQLTPDEARALENRPPKPNGDKLYIQGATVELGSQPAEPQPTEPKPEQEPEE